MGTVLRGVLACCWGLTQTGGVEDISSGKSSVREELAFAPSVDSRRWRRLRRNLLSPDCTID